MRKLAFPVLFSALLSGMLGAQAPAHAPAQTPARTPSQTPAPAKPAVNPNPGQGGLAPGQISSITPTSPEDNAKRIQQDADRITQMQAEAFGRQMDLTPAQVIQVRPILAERQNKLRALAGSSEAPDAAQRARMLQIQQETEAQLRTVLTPEQKVKFDQMIAARERMRQQQSARATANAARRAQMLKGTPAAGATPAGASSPAPASSSSAPASTPAPN